MYCNQCGAQIEDGLTFCTNCGAKLKVSEIKNDERIIEPFRQDQGQGQEQFYNNPVNYPVNDSNTAKNVNFGEAIKRFFINYVNFTGRASKSEYWWAVLFNVLVSLAVGWIPVVGQIVSLGLIIPGLAICIRRLHDIGKSWVWYLMGLIPLAGVIILIVYFCKDSDLDNQWGPAPRN